MWVPQIVPSVSALCRAAGLPDRSESAPSLTDLLMQRSVLVKFSI